MRKKIIKIISVIMIVTLFTTAFVTADVSADMSESQIRNEIEELEAESKKLEAEIRKYQNQINAQEKLKDAIEQKMAVVQRQINACNNQITSINSKIAANKAEIAKNNEQMEADKLAFKKRLRAIYMSNTGSNVQILLGAEDFSQFLQLSQLTASVSAHDKKMIEDIVEQIQKLEEKQKENNKLLEEQVAVKATIAEKQAELAKEEKQIQSVINSIRSDQKDVKDDNAAVEKDLKDMRDALNALMYESGDGTNMVYDGGAFLWPTPTISRVSSYFGSRWGRMHNGIDISNGRSMGAKIVAIADGVVETYWNSCKHNYGKDPLRTCCGNGYGNYVTINHGKSNGQYYIAYYAHMGSIVVRRGQKVKKGQIVGYVGSTGRSTGAHLHFGIMLQTRNSKGTVISSKWADPMKYYKKVG